MECVEHAASTIAPPKDEFGRSLLRTLLWSFLVSMANPANAALGEVKLSPPYPEIEPSFFEKHWPALAVAGFALVSLAIVIVIFRGRLRSLPKPAEPPADKARRELNELLRLQPRSEPPTRASRILRQYLVARFELPSEELTTREFAASIKSASAIPAELGVSCIQFFNRCDELKFAPDAAPDAEMPRRALELIEDCERLRAAATPAQSSQPPVSA